MRRAIVTGGHGFIGSHLCAVLEYAGWHVEASGRPDHELPSATFDAIVAQGADLLIHCATPASVADSLENPHSDLTGSVVVLSAVLETLARAGVRPRILFVSSAAVYGQPAYLPVAEDAPAAPISPYGLHRAMCEALLADRARRRNLPYAVARVFSAYGPGLRRQLLWDICRMAVNRGRITLGGTGDETRDLLHVRDVARALATIVDKSPFAGETINVASGTARSIASVAEGLANALGVDRDRIAFSGVRRAGDPPAWRADVSRLAALGFSPAVPFDHGMREYADWAVGELRSSPVAP